MVKLLFVIIIFFLPAIIFSADKLNIVTSTTDLSDFVKVIGKDKVNVISLCKGTQDPHFIEPRPSMVIKVRNADMVVRVGMDMDIWMQSIIDTSRNSKIMYNSIGYLDASINIKKLEIPVGKVDASQGDIHIYGNPHYWLDPDNAKIILKNILNKLCKLLPSSTEYFNNNYNEYLQKLESFINRLDGEMKKFRGSKIVTYHNSWPYFARKFGLEIIGFIEPKPGIPPNPSHILSLVEKMKKEKVKVIIIEPYFNINVAETVAKDSESKVLVLPLSVGGWKEADTYLDLLEYNINNLIELLQR